MKVLSGTVSYGLYQLLAELGQGGMGTVYPDYNLSLETDLAIERTYAGIVATLLCSNRTENNAHFGVHHEYSNSWMIGGPED